MDRNFEPYLPICSVLLKKHSHESLDRLRFSIDKEKNLEVLASIQEYVFLPLQYYLRDPSLSENYTINVLDFIRNYSSRSPIQHHHLFRDLLRNLLKLKITSEDSAIAVNRLIGALYANTHPSVLERATQDESYKYELSQILYNLLKFSKNNSHELIFISLESVAIVVSIDSNHEFLIKDLVPGLLSKCVNIIKNPSLKSKGIARAVDTWKIILIKYFINKSLMMENVEASNHICTHIKMLLPFAYHTSTIVRRTVGGIFECILPFPYFKNEVLELGVALAAYSETPSVIVEKLVQNSEDISFISDSVKNRLVQVINTPVTSLTTTDLLNVLGLLHFYLGVESYNPFLITESYASILFKSLNKIGSLRSIKVISIHDTSFDELERIKVEYLWDSKECLDPKIEYDNLRDSLQIQTFSNICSVLSHMDNIDIFVELLLIRLQNISSDDDNSSLLHITNLILLKHNLKDSVAEKLADYLLSNHNYFIRRSECLVTLISSSSSYIKEEYLSSCLCYLVSHPCDWTKKFLSRLSVDVRELLRTYFHPLSQHLFLLLRKISSDQCFEESPLLLLNLVIYFQEDHGSLKDIFSVLLSQLDISWMESDEDRTIRILKIIKASVLTFSKDNQTAIPLQNSLMEKKKSSEKPGAITDLIKNMIHNDSIEDKIQENLRCPDEGFHSDDKEDSGLAINEDEELKVILTSKQEYLKDCILRSRHFISMVKKPLWQILSMEIICSSIKVSNLPQDELLPLVHQIWQPLRCLFDSDNLLVLDRCFSLLKVLAEFSFDFIRVRAEKEAFPSLLSYLNKLVRIMENRKHTNSHRLAKKLASSMLPGLWDFMNLLDLSELSSCAIICAIDDVRAACNISIDDLKPVRDIDEDAIFLKNYFSNLN